MSNPLYRINRPEVIDEYFEDEYVIVNLKTGAYYSLNLAGAAIWDAVTAGAGQDDVVKRLLLEFDADEQVIAAHVERLLADLVQEALIVPDSQSPAAPSGSVPAAGPATRRPFTPPLLEKFTDMQALLLLDPIHQVDDTGWPAARPNAR